MNVGAYLDRIGYAGAAEPTHAVLAALQRAHMLTVPFENLDIALGRRLVLDRRANYAKIVERRRGGWCFELNGLFGWLLEQLGYRVTLLGSRVDGERGAGSTSTGPTWSTWASARARWNRCRWSRWPTA